MTSYQIRRAGGFCLLAFFFACNNQPEKTVVPPANTIDTIPKDTITSTARVSQGEHTHTIEIRQMKFNPDDLNIPRGDTVVWVNNDITNHCITEVNKAWTSGTLTPRQSYKRVFTKSTNYFCAIHMVMNGKITVQ